MFKWLFTTIIALSCTFGTAFSQNSNHALYGYFFYTIAKNVEWPSSYKTGDFVIGILGDSPVIDHLKMMASKKDVAGRSIKIAVFQSVSQISKCNMLFVPLEKSEEIETVVEKLSGTATMVLSEKEGLAMRGSCINFVVLLQNQRRITPF